MVQRVLESGWGVVLSGLIALGLAYADLSVEAWRAVIVPGLLLTPAMLYHKRLRHFVLLPSGIALMGGIVLMVMNMKIG
ncbi:MAG: DUF1435 domain-containing protein [Pseudescherichia vulneris]|nr:DUF1435 domain-containing protein [Pseudescherichia vulneris]